MHWILLANGDCHLTPRIAALIDCADRLVAVDGGSRHLEMLNRLPHLVIGDMDSIPAALLRRYHGLGIQRLQHPPRKDATDLELALDLAFREGATQVTILGAAGGRLDHTLGNLFLLRRCLENGVLGCIEDNEQTIHLISDDLKLTGQPGDILSLLPVTPEANGVTLAGLEYPLQDATLHFGTTQGISNIFSAHTATINLNSGLLLVFHLHKA